MAFLCSRRPQIGLRGTTARATAFVPPNMLANDTMRVTRTTALNVRYRFKGMLDSMTMTLIIPVPPRPVVY